MAPVDAAMIHDITGPLAIQKFREMGGKRVFDPGKVIMLFDHQVPADSIPAAQNHIFMRMFAEEQGIRNLDLNEGVCHQVVEERGLAAPGEVVVGADSHTCMYGATGAFATGIGSTDMGFVLKFGALYFRVPGTIRVEVNGTFGDRVGPKDLILSIAGDIGSRRGHLQGPRVHRQDHGSHGDGREDDLLQHGRGDGGKGRDRSSRQDHVGIPEGEGGT